MFNEADHWSMSTPSFTTSKLPITSDKEKIEYYNNVWNYRREYITENYHAKRRFTFYSFLILSSETSHSTLSNYRSLRRKPIFFRAHAATD